MSDTSKSANSGLVDTRPAPSPGSPGSPRSPGGSGGAGGAANAGAPGAPSAPNAQSHSGEVDVVQLLSEPERALKGRAESDAAGAFNADALFFPIALDMLFPFSKGRFRVFLRRDGRYILYSREGFSFCLQAKQRLQSMGVDRVYVLSEQRVEYERYMETNLGSLLQDESLPLQRRAKTFFTVSKSIVKEMFHSGRTTGICQEHLSRAGALVEASFQFLSGPDALRELSKLIAHTYTTYAHSVQVYIYSMMLLNTPECEGGVDDDIRRAVGLGAILHDLGKSAVPKTVLDKPGQLSTKEWALIKSHPAKGAELCSAMPLDELTSFCILHHHEKLDGTGYPDGLKGADLPMGLRALTLADIYDALTTRRVYAPARSPFAALQLMRDQMGSGLDMDLFRRLVEVLAGAAHGGQA